MTNLHTSPGADRLLSMVARLVLGCLLFTGLVLTYLSGVAPQRVHAQGDTYIVTILGSAQVPGYAPALLTVHVYDTVIFLNQSQPAAPYAVVADDGDFSSPPIMPGKEWSVTLSTPGAFEYHENASPSRMAGVIVVVPGSVLLLPSPLPAVQSTAIAYIKAGQVPPDTVWQQTSTAQENQSRNASPNPVTTSSSPFLLSLALAALLVIVLELGVFSLVKWGKPAYRFIRARWKDEDEDDE